MNDGGQITPYLTVLPDEQYSLTLGATFDPFATRSENGFLILEDALLQEVKADAHYIGDENAKVTWLEYTDVNCHYCKKMELDGTAQSVMDSIGDNLNKTSSHFIGVGGQASQVAAETLECIASVGSSDLYNSGLSEALISGDNTKATLIANAVIGGINEVELNACIDNNDSKETVDRKFKRGQEAFGITGTPGNVIINNETGEYEIISGAYPASAFEEIINKMLAQ
jgi:protein-disulfide isomerase